MAEETNFNYIDFLNNSTNSQYMAEQHDKAIQTQGRKTYVFMLDRDSTKLSEVYKEEMNGRIYLPHFEQRALYKTNTFLSQLGANGYTETEDSLVFEYDFGRMVYNIHELKSKSSGVMTIKNISTIPVIIEINDYFIVKNNIEELFKKKIEGNVFTFVKQVNEEQKAVSLTYKGDGENLDFLDRSYFKLLPRRIKDIDLNNSIYKSTGDTISKGDIVITDRMRVYQVVGAYPKDDSYGKYITWKVQCNLINMAKVDGLPNDYAELVKKNQYSLGNYNLG